MQLEAGRPLDGSDIQTADEAMDEVRRLRNILASASALPEPWKIYEDENGYVYYHNTSTNEVQWNHPLSVSSVESNQDPVAAAPTPTHETVGKSLLLYHSKLRTAAEHVVQRLLKEEVEYEHKINLEMLEYIASLREELRELQGHKRITAIEDAQDMTEELEEQANYAAVESAKDQLIEKKAKHKALMARLEKKRQAKRKKLQKMKSETAHTIKGIETTFEQKLQKQVSDAKHVMSHLEGGKGEVAENATNDDEKWVELFDEESGRPYWWSKTQGSTWEKPIGIGSDVFNSVQSGKCTADTNKLHIQEFLQRSNSLPSSDGEKFTMEWIDKHAVQTERLKNQELWEKALELEEKLAHEREKAKGKELRMMEHLEHQTQQKSTSNYDDAALTSVEGQTITGGNMYEMPPDESSNAQAGPPKEPETPNGEGFSDIMQENTNETEQTPPGHRLSTVNAVFEAGPLGLELVNRKHGGVIVKSVQPGFQAAHTRIIRRAMSIYAINEEDYSTADLATVMKALRETPRPVSVTFTLPGELNYITTNWQDHAQTY